ncbi:MAG: Rrf2 family transcriptional regulator [Vicinamibacterales bacterium]
MLSRKSKYGLKALLVLAREGNGRSLHVSEIASREAIPKKFLEAILVELKRHGFVTSRKGPGGGYALSRRSGEITFGAVVRVLEGPLALVPCVSQTAYRRCDDCVDETACGVRIEMQRVRDATAAILDNTTLSDMNRRITRTRTARDGARRTEHSEKR